MHSENNNELCQVNSLLPSTYRTALTCNGIYMQQMHILSSGMMCHNQGIFTAVVLKKWSDVGDFVHLRLVLHPDFHTMHGIHNIKKNSFHADFNLENKCINLSPHDNNLNHTTTPHSRVLPYKLRAPQQLKKYLKHFLKPIGSLLWSKKFATSPNPAPN